MAPSFLFAIDSGLERLFTVLPGATERGGNFFGPDRVGLGDPGLVGDPGFPQGGEVVGLAW